VTAISGHVFEDENSNGVHDMSNLPIVLMGRAGGRLSRSGVVDEGYQSHYQLGTSVLNLMGVDAAGFGDKDGLEGRPASGPLRGLI